MQDVRSTPFQSSDFCLQVKILKSTKHKLKPGATSVFFIKKSKPSMVHPNMLQICKPGNNYGSYTGTPAAGDNILLYDYMRGGKFYLFKMSANQLQSSTGAGLGTSSVGANTLCIRMQTDYQWTYKYIQSIASKITNTAIGLSAPTGNQAITVYATGTEAITSANL